MNWKLGLTGWLVVGGALALECNCAFAQSNIVPDNTLGAQSSVVTPNVDINGIKSDRIDGGAIRSANLFHSFREFNIDSGQGAYFTNSAGIENIFSRVTGGNASNILGKLGVLGNANLFLINPSGIIFGRNASLDVRGSFLATTASSFKFSNGSEFSATNPQAPPLLTINVTPGLQYGSSQPGATITNTGNLVAGQDLTLNADKLDLQGQLRAGRDLTLLAQDTVRVRDSVTTGFIATAGGNLTIVGDRGIDILALNHPTQTPFVSGGNLSLISDGIISGDAHFASGGSFSIRSVSGGLANFVSKYDPIISATGDVDAAANYTGASLLVESQGNIRFQGDINITEPDTSALLQGPDTATLSTSSALILRSGQSALAYGGVNSGSVPADGTGTVPAGITLGGAVTLQPFNGSGGIVSLSAASGNVSTQGITTNGGAININSAGAIATNGQILDARNEKNGGDITLSSNGKIATGDLRSDSRSFEGTAGNGGAISMSATNGNITTGDLRSNSGTVGNGGAISMSATNGSITTGKIATGDLYSDPNSFTIAGNGGAISMSATNGNITTGDLYSNSRSFEGTAGNGGAISMSATNGSITTGAVDSSSQSGEGTAGNGGAISMSATNGSITTGPLGSSSESVVGIVGNGGAISMSATNNINVDGYLESFSSTGRGLGRNGGAISLFATKGSITTGGLVSYSDSSYGTGGNGGAISLFASNTIKTDTIISTGKLGSGNITLASNAPFTLDSIISSDTFGSGKGGDIQITAPSISLIKGAQVSASTHSTGQGGNITLVASDKVEVNGSTTTPPEILFNTVLTGIPIETNLGGFILTDVQDFTVLPNGLFTQTTIGSTGNAGNLRIETGQLIVRDGAAIATTTFGQGSAGNILVHTKDSISVANGSILSGVAGRARGDSGRVDLATSSLSVTGGGVVQTQTLGEGKAGDIRVNAKDAVSLSGNGSGLRSGSGSNNLLGTTGSFIGVGGNISVTTDKLSVADQAVLDAQTQTNSKGGNITVNADSLSAEKGGQLLTSTSGAGQAGDITVNAREIQLSGSNSGLFAQTSSSASAGNLTLQPLDNGQTLKVNFQDGAQVSASTSSSGSGGKLTVTAPESITLSGNGSIISAETTGKGAGGDLTLRTGKLTVRDGAQVTVSSANSGTAGSLTVDANSIRLDNSAKISADTRGGGGNINLRSPLLVLRRGSSITTNATGSNIPGGNITIDALNGFIVAVPQENSDISANSTEFFGGKVIVNAFGVFGTKFRDAPTRESDITATGGRPEYSGTVQINTSGIDPNSGLVNLPAVPVDTQVTQSCTAGGAQAQSQFIITGRGGLPPNPGEVLTTDAVQVDLVTLPSQEAQRQESRRVEEQRNTEVYAQKINSVNSPIEIVEAKGWVLDANGNVVLVATAPTVTPHSLLFNPASCRNR